MQSIQSLEKNYSVLSQDDLFDISGGLAVTIGGVTLVLTAKGVAMAAGIIGGAYSVGYVIGQGWANIK